MPRAAARILQHSDCPSPPSGTGHDLGRMDWAPGMRGEAGPGSPGSRSNHGGFSPGSRSDPRGCLPTWFAFGPDLGIPVGPELSGLHSDSHSGSTGSRECFARQQCGNQGLGGQQGVPVKLSLVFRLRGAAESLCTDLAEPDSSKPVYPPTDRGLPGALGCFSLVREFAPRGDPRETKLFFPLLVTVGNCKREKKCRKVCFPAGAHLVGWGVFHPLQALEMRTTCT